MDARPREGASTFEAPGGTLFLRQRGRGPGRRHPVPGPAPQERRCSISRRCKAVCKDGSPCRCWAVRGSDPPRCAAHGGGNEPHGPSKGNLNGLKHGFYARSDLPEDCTIDALIDNAYQRHLQLDRYIDQVVQAGAPSIKEVVNLLRLHGQSTGRLSKLLRDQRALTGDAADGISAAIAQALDELGTEWGVDL